MQRYRTKNVQMEKKMEMEMEMEMVIGMEQWLGRRRTRRYSRGVAADGTRDAIGDILGILDFPLPLTSNSMDPSF